MTEATVAELTEAVANLTTAFTTFATDVNQTIADLEAKEAGGGTISTAELGPIKDSLATLTSDVAAADAIVKADDPGEPVVAPTTETLSISIDSASEGSVQLAFAPARVTITTPPESGTAVVEAVEGEPEATKLVVRSATPESTVTVTVSIAAE